MRSYSTVFCYHKKIFKKYYHFPNAVWVKNDFGGVALWKLLKLIFRILHSIYPLKFLLIIILLLL